MRVDGWLLAVCASRAFMTSMFMTYAATLPMLRGEWGMSGTAAGSISTGFQLGYAVSLVCFSSLADRVGARRVFLGSAWLSAVAALAFALFARSYLSGLALYTLVALSQGGTYTTAIMLFADRYPPARRGGAVGWLIASSSAGYALSLLVSGVAVAWGGYPLAFFVSACGPALGVVIAWFALRTTPNVVHPRREDAHFGTAVLKNGPAMRLIAGYTFHSWELLGMWAWTPAFLASALGGAQQSIEGAAAQGAGLAALFHLMGLLATSVSGWLSDRWGRTGVIALMMTVSTLCSLSFGWLAGAPLLIVLFVGLIYSFSAIGDSPVYSTALSEVVEPRHLGSALAIRSLIGFGAGSLAPFAFGAVLDFTNRGVSDHQSLTWGWAYSLLGLGAAVGLFATLWLRRLPQSRLMAGGRR